MKNFVQSIKGTRDFYPEDMAMRTWLYQQVKEVSELFGYQEYEGPILESLDLYAAKSGEELVKEQSFVFPDRSGEMITLRPELTPTLARLVAKRQNQLNYPLRWWSFGPFWRYERPQKGRTREFFQWNIDLIGVNSPEADAELISIVANFFKKVGLTAANTRIMINDRQLLECELINKGLEQKQLPQLFHLIDRKEKLEHESWLSYAKETGLTNKQIDSVIDILNNGNLWHQSANLQRVFEALDALSVSEYVQFDPKIVRGLDYYTSTVFEAKEIRGSVQRSILGGGRYDNLLAAVGGEPLPAVGFAMGDVVISIILKNYDLFPDNLLIQPAQVMVTVFDQNHFKDSLQFSNLLRGAGINTLCYPNLTPLGKQFKFASSIGIKIAIVIGPEEIKATNIAIKNLITGEQVNISYQESVNYISKLLDIHFAS